MTETETHKPFNILFLATLCQISSTAVYKQ